MTIAEYVQTLSDQNLYHLVNSTCHGSWNSLDVFKKTVCNLSFSSDLTIPTGPQVHEDPEEEQLSLQKQKFCKTMQLYEEQQGLPGLSGLPGLHGENRNTGAPSGGTIESFTPFLFLPCYTQNSNRCRRIEHSNIVMENVSSSRNNQVRLDMSEWLVRLLEKIQKLCQKVQSPVFFNSPEQNPSPIMITLDKISSADLSETFGISGIPGPQEKKKTTRRQRPKKRNLKGVRKKNVPYSSRRRSRNGDEDLMDPMDSSDASDPLEPGETADSVDLLDPLDSADHTMDLSANGMVLGKHFSLEQIRDSIEKEIKIYKQRLEFKPGMTSVDRRKHSSVIKRDFYRWYFEHVTDFMDGYLFPHKELRKHFEVANLGQQSEHSPDFTAQDLEHLSQILNSYVTKEIALSPTRQNKIRNRIIHLGILFRSYLDFMSCLESESRFNFTKGQWIQSIETTPYDKLGKSTRDAIKKSLEQYKFRPTTEIFCVS